MVRNVPAERGYLADHGFLIRSLDRRQCSGDNDRTDHGKGRRQAHLKPNAFRQRAVFARRDKVEVRGARFTGIAELAEMHVRWRDAFSQREEWKPIGRADCARRIWPQIGARAQQWVLPANPKLASADLAIGDAAQMRAEQLSDGAKNLFHRVETDASDEMNRLGRLHLAHAILPITPIRVLSRRASADRRRCGAFRPASPQAAAVPHPQQVSSLA